MSKQKMQQEFKEKNILSSAADFCPLCGNIIELPSVADIVECNRCNFQCPILDYHVKHIVTNIVFDEKKQWIDQYTMRKAEIEDLEENDNSTKATIKQDCPKCAFDTMFFWTVQLRSVDEGSTVFYECMKCKNRFQQHN